MRTLIILLLWASLAHGAQSIVIPQGTTIYGPFAVNTLHRYTTFAIVRDPSWTNPAITLYVILEISFDKGATYPHQCEFGTRGGTVPNNLSGLLCPVPAGATHIKATATATGGSITVQSLAGGSKP
jgi:hypothetical protein